MLPQPHTPKQASTANGPEPDPRAEACGYCGVIDRPTLSAGSGPHACRASCGHCGRFLRWISLQAPSERMARRVQEKMKAMAKLPPSPQQLEYLKALGDVQDAPETMLEASARIDEMVRQKGSQP